MVVLDLTGQADLGQWGIVGYLGQAESQGDRVDVGFEKNGGTLFQGILAQGAAILQ